METAQITLHFVINYETQNGEDVYVLGNHPEFGNWSVEKGIKLVWSDNHDWTGTLQTSRDGAKTIEYKYVVYNKITRKIRWEEGSNRQIHFFLIPVHGNEVHLNEVWEHLLVTLRIKYDCMESQRLMVSGNLFNLGNWKTAIPMTRVNKFDPIHQQETVYWEKKVYIHHDRQIFQYRYAIEDLNTKNQLWEREPDRVCDLMNLGSASHVGHSNDTNKKDCIAFYRKHNKYIKLDVNFVANFYFNQITDKIFIGPYPQSTKDIELLTKNGIDSLLNLQATRDMKYRRINWDNMVKLYNEQNIKAVNFQIVDMSLPDMEQKAFEAACHLNYLCQNYKKTYVHCTAGIGRAPQTVVAYLMFFQGYSLDDAVKLVKSKRLLAYIHKDCLMKAFNKNQHCKDTHVNILKD